MNETLRDKLDKLCRDAHIQQVDLAFKCKTKDGMLYTLDIVECRKAGCPEGVTFAELLEGHAIQGVLLRLNHAQEARTEEFYFSAHESVAIRKDEIVRIWADIGRAHYGDGTQII